LRLDEALGPIREIVAETELGRLQRPLWHRVRWPLEDDVVGATDGAHDICGETGRRKPVSRVDRAATSAFNSCLNNAGELCLVGQPGNSWPGRSWAALPIADENKARTSQEVEARYR
jgi:hypothetical protein